MLFEPLCDELETEEVVAEPEDAAEDIEPELGVSIVMVILDSESAVPDDEAPALEEEFEAEVFPDSVEAELEAVPDVTSEFSSAVSSED